MITHIFVDPLAMAELPIYEFPRPADHWYSFNPGRQDVRERAGPGPHRTYHRVYEGHYWESRIRPERALLNTDIDIFVEDMVPLVGGWLDQVHLANPDVPGTLVMPIRSNMPMIDEGIHLQTGLAFVPIPWGVRLGEACPIQVVQEVIQTHRPDQLSSRLPIVQEILSAFVTEERHQKILNNDYDYVARKRQLAHEQDRAEQRALRLLYSNLSEEQIVCLEENQYFYVLGGDERRYKITDAPQHNVFLMQGGREVIEFCVVTKLRIPVYDLMLMQKLLLESNPDMFWENANRWTIDLAGERTLVYVAPREERIRPNLFPDFREAIAEGIRAAEEQDRLQETEQQGEVVCV